MNKNKHDHKATKKLKVFLFALFMILPFLVWIPNAFYYGFNAQAQASERIEHKQYNTTNPHTSFNVNDLEIDTLYTIEFEYLDTNFTILFEYCNISYIYSEEVEYYYDNSIDNYLLNISEGEYALVNMDTYQVSIKLPASGTINMVCVFNQTQLEYLQHYAGDIFNLNFIGGFDGIVYSEEYVAYTNSITDSMSVAWQQTWSNPLFSWNNSNPLLEPLTNFTNVFGITTDSCIPQALCYLATITMIYVVFDIIIELFTKLTHLINRSD